MNKVLSSSVDPKELSLTIKGALVVIAPIAGLVIKAGGGEISNDELSTIIQTIGDVVVAVGGIVSAVMMVAGLLRKVYFSFKK